MYLHVVKHAYNMSVQICASVPMHTLTCICVFNTGMYKLVFTVFLPCVCIFSRLRGGGSVRQCEAEPEGVHQEDSVPGQPAAQFAEELQPRQQRTIMP